MDLVRNERLKLLAAALNNVAVATLVTALIGPSASFLYGLTNPFGGQWRVAIGLAWLATAILLHMAASLVLGRLRA